MNDADWEFLLQTAAEVRIASDNGAPDLDRAILRFEHRSDLPAIAVASLLEAVAEYIAEQCRSS